MTMPQPAGDYVLGTHDAELERLGLQHRVWRPWVSEAWLRAGFTTGDTLIDVGCGPGFATVDLAEIVGETGRVVAIDRSERFLDALENTTRVRGLPQIDVHRADLDVGPFPDVRADGAWARWVFAFLRKPRSLLAQLSTMLKPGARLVVHEYFDYSTWHFIPHSDVHEEFVRLVTKSWRASGGEPNIAMQLIPWLADCGFALDSLRPIVHVIKPGDYMWQWPKSFIGTAADRLHDLGEVDAEGAARIKDAFIESEAIPNVHIVTPAVMEIVARKL